MTTETKQNHSQVLAGEIDRLQSEIPRLKLERDTLGRIPILPVGADPSEIAEKISSSVSGNSSRLRGIDSALATLTKSLASKRLQLAELREAERKADATQALAELHQKAISQCEKINQISQLLETEVSRLRQTERELAPARHVVMPGYPYPYLSVDETATVLSAQWSTVGVHVTVRPLHSS